MTYNDIISVTVKSDKVLEENERKIITSEQTYFSPLFNFPVVILFDKYSSINHSLFLCSVIRELRKTSLDDKIWCEKQSSIFNHYKCHFNTLTYLLESKCVLIFVLDHLSFKRQEFINYLQALKKRTESNKFKLISVIDNKIKSFTNNIFYGLEEELCNFIKSEIFNKGYNVDLSSDVTEESLSLVAEILPKIVTHVYTPHQFASIDLQQFYQNLSPSDTNDISYTNTPMYMWEACDICDWLDRRGYPMKFIEELEYKGINGWIIQNVTAEDLAAVTPSFSSVIRNKLIFDIYDFLNKIDTENNNWQMTSRKINVQQKEVYIVNDNEDANSVNKFVTTMKLQGKLKFVYNISHNHTKESCVKLKNDAQRIARSKIIIVFITKNSFVNGFNTFKKSIRKKILFSLWIKRSIIFILWDSDLKIEDLACKIIIDNLPIIDFRSNTLDYNCKLLAELFEVAIQNKNKDKNNEVINLFEKSHLSKVSNLSDRKCDIDLSIIKNEIKKKIVLHYHVESQKKVERIQKMLESNQYYVELISVNRGGFLEADSEMERNKREEIIIESDALLTCLSQNYVQSRTTKEDLRFICQILHKTIVVIVLEHITDMKMWHQIKTCLYSAPKSTLKKHHSSFSNIPTIDLSKDKTCSTLVRDIKNFL